MQDIVVVDYGMGNIRSVAKALEFVAPRTHRVIIANEPDIIGRADRVVFPGQGAMPDCLRELKKRNLMDSILESAKQKPFLGICIGLQMLFEGTEEGNSYCLGLLKGHVKKFSTGSEQGIIGEDHKYKVPHMGWNTVHQIKPHSLWSKIPDNSRFYFVHSYFVTGTANEIVVANTSYSAQFVSAISKDNIFAVQFHPEKSQRVGLQLLSNFLKWDGYA